MYVCKCCHLPELLISIECMVSGRGREKKNKKIDRKILIETHTTKSSALRVAPLALVLPRQRQSRGTSSGAGPRRGIDGVKHNGCSN